MKKKEKVTTPLQKQDLTVQFNEAYRYFDNALEQFSKQKTTTLGSFEKYKDAKYSGQAAQTAFRGALIAIEAFGSVQKKNFTTPTSTREYAKILSQEENYSQIYDIAYETLHVEAHYRLITYIQSINDGLIAVFKIISYLEKKLSVGGVRKYKYVEKFAEAHKLR